jgi:hypothetical protein
MVPGNPNHPKTIAMALPQVAVPTPDEPELPEDPEEPPELPPLPPAPPGLDAADASPGVAVSASVAMTVAINARVLRFIAFLLSGVASQWYRPSPQLPVCHSGE